MQFKNTIDTGSMAHFFNQVVATIEQIKGKSTEYLSRYPTRLSFSPSSAISFNDHPEASGHSSSTGENHNDHTQYFLLLDILNLFAKHCEISILLEPKLKNQLPHEVMIEKQVTESFGALLQEPVESSKLSQPLSSFENLLKNSISLYRAQQATIKVQAEQFEKSVSEKSLTFENDTLCYFSFGEGSQSIFLVNAFGLGLEFWWPLFTQLKDSYRIIVWQNRNPSSGQQNNVYYDVDAQGIEYYCRASAEILSKEGIEACHLLAWCSGPKLAIELASREPELVQSMTFLTPSFPGVSVSTAADSPFEKNLNTMCSLVNKMPHAAKSMVASMQAIKKKEESDLEKFDKESQKEKAVSIFSVAQTWLTNCFYAPFSQEKTMVLYSKQLAKFRQHDISGLIQGLKQPVLLIVGDEDTTTNSTRALEICREIPNFQAYQLITGNHYIHTEHPQLIADAIQYFIREGDDTEKPITGLTRLY